jgi:hypothetical protein
MILRSDFMEELGINSIQGWCNFVKSYKLRVDPAFETQDQPKPSGRGVRIRTAIKEDDAKKMRAFRQATRRNREPNKGSKQKETA